MQDLNSLPALAGYAGIAAVAAAAGAFWGTIRGVLAWPVTWFTVTADLDDHGGRILLWHLRRTSTQLLKGRVTYGWSYYHIRRTRNYETVAYENHASGKLLLHRGWVPVLVRSGEQKKAEGAPEGGGSFHFASVRGLVNMERLITEAMEAHGFHTRERQVGRRHFVQRLGASQKDDKTVTGTSGSALSQYRFVGYSHDDLGSPIPEDPFQYLAYPPEIRATVEMYRRWLKSKAWYEARSIPWRMGSLFTGLPGTGKTSCARAIAQMLDIPVFIVDLSQMGNSGLVRAWAVAKEAAPCMVLLEDIDRVSMARSDEAEAARRPRSKMEDSLDEAMHMFMPLTLDCLLNCISGIEPSEGILTVATANDPSKLDPALGVPGRDGNSTRPGRLDICVEFPPLDEAGRRSVAMQILAPTAQDVSREVLELAERLVAEGDGETGAQFTKRAADVALQRYWGGK